MSVGLTLEAVCVEEVLALLVTLDAALGAADALARDAPQQPLALVAVGGLLRRPQHEVVRRRRGDRVNHSLQRLLVHVQFLSKWKREANLRGALGIRVLSEWRDGCADARWARSAARTSAESCVKLLICTSATAETASCCGACGPSLSALLARSLFTSSVPHL